MEDQLSSFLDFLSTERNYSENTTAAYRNDLSQFLVWLGEEYPLTDSWGDVSGEIVGAYVKALEQKSYTASSIARKVAAIKSFFHYLLARGHISDDPTDGLDSPKVKKRLPVTLPAEDIRLLLEAPANKRTPKNLRDAALLNVLYATGMRVTEAVSLRVEDVDLAESSLICLGKDQTPRTLPFNQETRNILKDYLENGRPHLVKDKDVDALFLNHRGQQLTRQGLWLIIKAYADEANLGDSVTPHTLRHSFAAHRLNSGADLREVQHLLGHANISTTLVYSQMAESKEADD
jgi:integrase/recombinase XerD